MRNILGKLITALYNWYYKAEQANQYIDEQVTYKENIPVIGAKRIDWEEYRDIPKITINNCTPKFNRNNI